MDDLKADWWCIKYGRKPYWRRVTKGQWIEAAPRRRGCGHSDSYSSCECSCHTVVSAQAPIQAPPGNKSIEPFDDFDDLRLEPLGHDIDLDNDADVDWVMKWTRVAQAEIQRLENIIEGLSKENENLQTILFRLGGLFNRTFKLWAAGDDSKMVSVMSEIEAIVNHSNLRPEARPPPIRKVKKAVVHVVHKADLKIGDKILWSQFVVEVIEIRDDGVTIRDMTGLPMELPWYNFYYVVELCSEEPLEI